MSKIFTIGFTKKSAEEFFSILAGAKVERLIDVRLNNMSQLAGFAKRDDLRYFLRTLCGIDYLHCLDLAPTQEILDSYKKNKESWSVYERDFINLLESRKADDKIPPELLKNSCLLCSEAEPLHCHRRLVAEYFLRKHGNFDIVHL